MTLAIMRKGVKERVTVYGETTEVSQENMKAMDIGLDSGYLRIPLFPLPPFQKPVLISTGICVVQRKLIPPVDS